MSECFSEDRCWQKNHRIIVDDTLQMLNIFFPTVQTFISSISTYKLFWRQLPKSRAKVILQITSKITSACSIRPIPMTYRLLNVFVYCYGHTEIIYDVSRFKLFLCVLLRGVLLPDEIFLVFIFCNLIFGEISEWFIMNSLEVTHSTAQCHRRG